MQESMDETFPKGDQKSNFVYEFEKWIFNSRSAPCSFLKFFLLHMYTVLSLKALYDQPSMESR